ncbi:MAG: TonB family protein [Gammaproteobacteria bacterium]
MGYAPLTDRQRLTWAVMLAIAVHITAFLAIGFRLYSPPPPQPVFSLNLALLQQHGGEEQDILAGAALPAAAARASAAGNPGTAAAAGSTDAERRLHVPGPAADLSSGERTVQQNTETTAPGAPQQTERQTEQQTDQANRLARSPGASRPSRRSKTIAADDKTTLEGFYAEKWRLQIQSLGNQYMPPEAKAQGLTGQLTLDVAVRSDGTLLSITLLRSSGSVLLDNAARRIVMLAAPFEPFPESLRQRYDILHIVRTWEFDKSRQLRSDY